MRPPAPAGVDATSRSADGDVTRRRQTDYTAPPPPRAVQLTPDPEIVEFHDVHRRDDGLWTATHFRSGTVIEAGTFDDLAMIEAPQVRILYAWRVRVRGLIA
jgi:hypothetical protein